MLNVPNSPYMNRLAAGQKRKRQGTFLANLAYDILHSLETNTDRCREEVNKAWQRCQFAAYHHRQRVRVPPGEMLLWIRVRRRSDRHEIPQETITRTKDRIVVSIIRLLKTILIIHLSGLNSTNVQNKRVPIRKKRDANRSPCEGEGEGRNDCCIPPVVEMETAASK